MNDRDWFDNILLAAIISIHAMPLIAAVIMGGPW